MSATDEAVEAQRWLRYAREDLVAAQNLMALSSGTPRHICWFAQQAAEKALKAVLVFLQLDFPRRHDLDVLRNLVPDSWQLKREHLDLSALTEWAVEARYPGDWPEATDADAQAALECAQRVLASVGADLARHGFEAGSYS